MQRLNDHSFYHALEDTPGAALVVLTAASCGACAALKRALARLPAEAPPVALFELDAHESPGVVQDLEVFHLPAMFLYLDGEYHRPVHSVARPQDLARALRDAAAAPALEAP
jgi:thioredoxin 1